MITTKLTGNFGNHLAQHVSTRCIAETIGVSWGFDPKPTYDYYQGKEQLYFLDINYGSFPSNIKDTYKENTIIYNDKGDDVNISVFDANVYDISDNTELTGGCWQSEDYFKDFKEELYKWISYKKEYESVYKDRIKNIDIDNTCIINIRGGEYRYHSKLIIRKKYFDDSIKEMLLINPLMKFLVVTDDIEYSRILFSEYPIIEQDIGYNYYIINKAKWLILSNSSFPIFAAYLNKDVNKIIAPMYWARHNVSDGYWALGDQYYKGWYYMSREGILEDYDNVKNKALEWRNLNGY